jgi:hypothetical protein
MGPGVSDNGSGLAALLALGRLLRDIPALNDLADSVLLVANVGEEGEGNLSGMRYLCRPSSLALGHPGFSRPGRTVHRSHHDPGTGQPPLRGDFDRSRRT